MSTIALLALAGLPFLQHDSQPVHKQDVTVAAQSAELPKMPSDMPKWLNDPGADHLFYKPAPYNWAITRIPLFAKDMYATGVGHAMAYEALVRGKAGQLETKVFSTIDRVLKNQPSIPVDEGAISPTFLRRYGYLEKVFDWAHLLHFQTIDVFMYPGWTEEQKEAEIERLWQFYNSQPYAITGLPMNMEYLDSFFYSGKFRTDYPKVNGLFWGYHWLQTVNYDMLYRVPVADQGPQYEVIGERYRGTELYKTDRDFMPMAAEMSPRFAKRFPMIANSFDNLHMLHDNVNDILAQTHLTEAQKQEQVKIAIYRVLASTHAREEAGDGEPMTLHDHRHPTSMPGMGMMKGSEDDLMYMSGMGWMDMGECAHCSIRLPESNPWGATVTADGWTMTVRCLLCARDMAAETPGRAIIRAATEDPNRMLVMISDEEGNWKPNIPGVVFLETPGDHPECSAWSRAFTSADAFRKYVESHEEYKDAKPISLVEWAQQNAGTPDTYRKIDKPNPYKPPVLMRLIGALGGGR
ncbi:MAG: hypothetical protein KF784_02805 [Fimbriimonadaceae bacterium]|nr:hypothetical protein [Fimbriimonadaceae bacterium]